jgi:aryl-alcohol dehydrogenase-like predicted oxidoreductase
LTGSFKKDHNFSSTDIRNENPKLSGALFESYYSCSEKLKRLADEAGKPLYEIAFNWLRQKPEVTTIIGGVSSLAQLEKNLHSTSWDIDDELMKKINEVIAPFENI